MRRVWLGRRARRERLARLARLALRALRPGEFVQIGDTEGTVTSVGFLTTQIETLRHDAVTALGGGNGPGTTQGMHKHH